MGDQLPAVAKQKELVEYGLGMLAKKTDSIQRALTNATDAAKTRFITSVAEIIKNATGNAGMLEVLEKAPDTIMDCAFNCAQLQLNPNPKLREAWIIPRWNSKTGRKEACLDLGYMGALRIVMRSKEYYQPIVELVYQNCGFAYSPSNPDSLNHTPWYIDQDEPGELRLGYFILRPRDGGPPYIVIVTRKEIEKARTAGGDVWKYHFDEMAKKTVVLRGFRFIPLSSDEKEILSEEYVRLDMPEEEETPRPTIPKDGSHSTRKAKNLDPAMEVKADTEAYEAKKEQEPEEKPKKTEEPKTRKTRTRAKTKPVEETPKEEPKVEVVEPEPESAKPEIAKEESSEEKPPDLPGPEHDPEEELDKIANEVYKKLQDYPEETVDGLVDLLKEMKINTTKGKVMEALQMMKRDGEVTESEGKFTIKD